MSEPPNRILEFLTAPARPEGDACRSNRRRRSSARIELAWSEGAGWRTARARLVDISRGGAGLIVLRPPPEARAARIRFVEGEGSPWVEAEILGVHSEKPRRHRVRLRFLTPCPSFILRLAILDVVEPDEGAPAARYEWVTAGPGRGR